MARDAALVATWTRMIPGRESKSLEVFEDMLTFLGKQAAEGHCSPPEVWYTQHGAGGVAFVRGKSDRLLQIRESDEFARLLAQGTLTTEGLKVEFWYGGSDEANQRLAEAWIAAGSELGYL